jgi:hypothetical protein
MKPPKPPYSAASTRVDSPINAHELPVVLEAEGSGQGRTTTRVLKPLDLAPDGLAAGLHPAESEDAQSPSHRPRSHRKKRMSASFSDFTSAFDSPALPSEWKPPPEQDLPRVSHTLKKSSTTKDQEMIRCESSSDGVTTIAPQTPMRVLKPPSVREVVERGNQSISKNHSPLLGKAPYLHDIASTADTNIMKLSSMTSHLPFLKGATSLLASPKGTVEVDRKLVSLVPPSLRPEVPQISNEEAKTVTTSIVSQALRAEMLANSVRISRKNLPVNAELAELSRGVELSPQKGSRGQRKKLIASVHDL